MQLATALHLLLAGLLQAAAGGSQTPAPACEPVRSEECFVIEQLDPELDLDAWQVLGADLYSRGALSGARPPREAGLLLWRRTDLVGGSLFEWDVRFPERQTRLLHVERSGPTGTTLVFREMQPQAGRTLSADWLEDGDTLRLREWGGPQALTQSLAGASGGLFLLELLERLRDEGHSIEHARVFDPLSRTFEDLRVSTHPGAADGPWSGTRRIEFERADGSLAGAYLLRGGQVLGFQWQAGNLRVRRVEPGEYARRLEELLGAAVQASGAD